MIIKNIQINGFGNVENKNILLNDKINVIIGKNETGKSTLIEFIKSIFYGVNKNKDGKKFSDFERFKPWKGTDFSGKVSYSHNKKEYTVFRDFNKNNAKVYDKEGNELKNEFNKDRSRGAEIGFAHFGMDEETFTNSSFVKQSEIKISESAQRNIIQKLTNIIQSGSESISYERTREKLEKLLVEEVGTDRTLNKPKNIIKRGIEENEREKATLIEKRERKSEIARELLDIQKKKNEADHEKNEATKVFDIREKYRKLLIEKKEAFETTQKIMEKQKAEDEKNKKQRIKTDSLLISIVTIILIALCIFLKQYLLSILALVLGIAGLVIYRKFENKKDEVITTPDFDLTSEDLKKKENKEIEQLENSGVRKSLLERKISDLKLLIDGLEAKKRDLELEEHKLKLEDDSLKNSVNKLNEIEDNLINLYDRRNSLESLERSIKLAIRVLDDSYGELKGEVIPGIEDDIRESIAKTTNGKYIAVRYNDTQGLIVENTNGEIISIEKLSMGTIDQMYLGFRLAIASKFGGVPIIFDESFVYCDDERLQNILQTLNKLANDTQIIILSCTNREANILEKIGAEPNIIEI